jgi:multicomponent Na+:H+ antiporter subunit C
MLLILALVIGGLYATAVYLMLRRNIVKLIFGLMVLAHASNLLLFTVGGLVRGKPPLVPSGATAPPPGVADPFPEALVLTAIVISFALTAFAAVLVKRVYKVTGTDDSDALRMTDS